MLTDISELPLQNGCTSFISSNHAQQCLFPHLVKMQYYQLFCIQLVILVNYGILIISSVSSHHQCIPHSPHFFIIVKYLCFYFQIIVLGPWITSENWLYLLIVIYTGRITLFQLLNFHITVFASHLFMLVLANIFIYIPSISKVDLKWHMIKQQA